MTRCSSCGDSNTGTTFCTKCGTPKSPSGARKLSTCLECSRLVASGTSLCPDCLLRKSPVSGAATQTTPTYYPPPQSKTFPFGWVLTAALTLCLVALGNQTLVRSRGLQATTALSANPEHIQTWAEKQEENQRYADEHRRKMQETKERVDAWSREQQRRNDQIDAERQARINRQGTRPDTNLRAPGSPTSAGYDSDFESQLTRFYKAFQTFSKQVALRTKAATQYVSPGELVFCSLEQQQVTLSVMVECLAKMDNAVPHTSDPERSRATLDKAQKVWKEADDLWNRKMNGF